MRMAMRVAVRVTVRMAVPMMIMVMMGIAMLCGRRGWDGRGGHGSFRRYIITFQS
jgi:hypothetical protein